MQRTPGLACAPVENGTILIGRDGFEEQGKEERWTGVHNGGRKLRGPCLCSFRSSWLRPLAVQNGPIFGVNRGRRIHYLSLEQQISERPLPLRRDFYTIESAITSDAASDTLPYH